MPRKDPDQRRAFAREWMRERRRAILAAHPCPCGQPSTTIMLDPGTGKVTWSWAPERIEALLAAKRLRCDACATREVGVPSDAVIERSRERKRQYMQRVRGSRSEQPEVADSPDPMVTTSPRASPGRRGSGGKASAQPVDGVITTVFDDPTWRAERRRARIERRRALGMTTTVIDSDEEDEE